MVNVRILGNISSFGLIHRLSLGLTKLASAIRLDPTMVYGDLSSRLMRAQVCRLTIRPCGKTNCVGSILPDMAS
jgi:hypothetical protein